MTEDEARCRALADVPRETAVRLERFITLLKARASEQNLVAASTMAVLWSRHILDSVQLLPLAPGGGLWLDIGSGAGLPGLVVAALCERPIMLIEPRAKRCAFLSEAADHMSIAPRVTVVKSRAETAPAIPAAVISARAVAALPTLFSIGQRFASADTVWLLPKGRNAAAEVAAAETSWQADIALVPSITDSQAAIVVASAVAPRRRS